MLILLLLAAIAFIVISTTKFKLHPFLALIFAAIIYGLLSGIPFSEIIKSVNNGFGSTTGSIGIVIVVGCIIGTLLEESGGVYVMARYILKIVGEKYVPVAMLILGYIVSIPVFADSGFVILAPLSKALSKRAKITLATSTIALSLGLTITHCLVPPTPGPLAAAGIMGADLGLVILTGFMASILPVMVTILFVAKWASRIYIDPNPKADENVVSEKMKDAPSALKSFIPIILPLVLIVLKSISDFPAEPFGSGWFKHAIGFIGEPVVALLLGMILAFTLPKKFDCQMMSSTGFVGKAIHSAASIILITAAGGSFGMILRDSGIAEVIGSSLAGFNMGIWLPFLIAAALKTAQGSSTVATITTASIIFPLIDVLGFVTPLEISLAVTSICAGAMVVSHVNDSFFWIVTQMSGMNIKTGYKLHTLGTLICGLSAMLTIWFVFSIIK